MKQSEIRRVVFVTDKDEISDELEFVKFVNDHRGSMLSIQKCEEGFVCLVYLPEESIQVGEEVGAGVGADCGPSPDA